MNPGHLSVSVYDGHMDNWLPEGFKDTGSVVMPSEELRQAVIDGLELVGVSEIHKALGVTRSRVSMWSARRESSGFPEPLEELAAGPVFDMAAVRAWFEKKYGEAES